MLEGGLGYNGKFVTEIGVNMEESDLTDMKIKRFYWVRRVKPF